MFAYKMNESLINKFNFFQNIIIKLNEIFFINIDNIYVNL